MPEDAAGFTTPVWQNPANSSASVPGQAIPSETSQAAPVSSSNPRISPTQPVQPEPVQQFVQPEVPLDPGFSEVEQVPQFTQEELEQYAAQQQQLEQEQGDPMAYTVPQYAAGPVQPEPEYLLLEWVADSRVTWKRSKEYYSSLAVIVLLVSLILFFAGQTLLIFVVLALLFISYVLSTVRAESVTHQITTYGIRYRGEKLIYWSELGRFWIHNNHAVPEIHIEAPTQMWNELIILPPRAGNAQGVTTNDILDILSRYLIFEEPLPSQLDRWVLWLQEKFPLE